MPTYEFKCDKCESSVDLNIPFHAAESVPVCTTCGGSMRKSFTSPAVQFKGGGWGGQ